MWLENGFGPSGGRRTEAVSSISDTRRKAGRRERGGALTITALDLELWGGKTISNNQEGRRGKGGKGRKRGRIFDPLTTSFYEEETGAAVCGEEREEGRDKKLSLFTTACKKVGES